MTRNSNINYVLILSMIIFIIIIIIATCSGLTLILSVVNPNYVVVTKEYQEIRFNSYHHHVQHPEWNLMIHLYKVAMYIFLNER